MANKVDAPIGKLLPGTDIIVEICQIGKIKGVGQAVEGMIIRKHGRTTGLTEGMVTDESVDALIGMDHNDPQVVALFQNQMRIEKNLPHVAIGLGGDSGFLVVDKVKS